MLFNYWVTLGGLDSSLLLKLITEDKKPFSFVKSVPFYLLLYQNYENMCTVVMKFNLMNCDLGCYFAKDSHSVNVFLNKQNGI
jgi:hypothetical protein